MTRRGRLVLGALTLAAVALLALRRVPPPAAVHFTGGRCAGCHGVTRLANHTAEFVAATHGPLAAREGDSCRACHGPSSCEACHRARTPEWHRGGLVRPGVGAGAWRDHARVAAARRSACTTCHAATQHRQCGGCHRAVEAEGG